MTERNEDIMINDDGSVELPCAGCEEPLLFYPGDQTHICMVDGAAYPICKACYDNDDLDIVETIRQAEAEP